MTKHFKPSVIEGFIEKSTPAQKVPLISTAYDIRVSGVLATVSVTRLFRNDESNPIEATITFPVPFDAVVTGIETKIGDRKLVGKSSSKVVARQNYEGAIDAGKAAVLHEELLRGLHMLSVANVAPGAEIEVRSTFLLPFACNDAGWRLRIPVTIGQVYGQFPLPDSDAVLIGGSVQRAAIKATAKSGTLSLIGTTLERGAAVIPLDRPIEFDLRNPDLRTLKGVSADGRGVTLDISAAPVKNSVLDVDVLLDVSGSMKERVASSDELRRTKWDVVTAGLMSVASRLSFNDRVRLWTFSSSCREIGAASGEAIVDLVRNCPFDNGGTEIPAAVMKVSTSKPEANILLITDGKSWGAIDVQEAIAQGARFTVVLVGEDALETNVGYLAAMSGGQMFVTHAGDADAAICAALASMRSVGSPVAQIDAEVPSDIDRVVSGVKIRAVWGKTSNSKRTEAAGRIAAYAAGLAIAGMKEGPAAALATAEGIVSHLTSIVMVDEAGAAVEGVPSTRKVALPSPATSQSMMRSRAIAASSANIGGSMLYTAPQMSFGGDFMNSLDLGDLSMFHEIATSGLDDGGLFAKKSPLVTTIPNGLDLSQIAARIDWDADATSLSNGIVTTQNASVRASVMRIALLSAVIRLAKILGVSAETVAVALIARHATVSARTAGRIARSVLSGADAALVDEAAQAAGQ